MSKDYMVVASDSGAIEIIKKSDFIKAYLVMPEANTVAFCWHDSMTGNDKEFFFTPVPAKLLDRGGAVFYFQSLVNNLCDSDNPRCGLSKELINTRVKSYRCVD